MAVTTNTRKLAALLGASGAGIGTDGLLQAAAVDANVATQAELDAVSTTVTANSADTTSVRQDVTILALREAVNTNSGDFNLPNSFIDDFHDATGSGTYTTTERDSTSEYVSARITVDAQLTGSNNWTVPTGVTSVEVLVVAGGGSGFKSGNVDNGGGGGGGIVYDTALATTPAATIAYVVGATADATPLFVTSYKGGGVQGNDSTFGSYTAKGGGVGAGYPADAAYPESTYAYAYFDGAVGGSGGGGAHNANVTNASNQATAGTSASGTITVYGNSGYGGATGYAGGGGGAGAAATNKNGGAGQLFSNFTSYGVSGYFGGGGGAGKASADSVAASSGGSGGGGAGGSVSGGSSAAVNGTSGTAGTGGGGGGMSQPSGYSTANGPGSGGSGFIGLIWNVLSSSGNLIGNANVPSSAQTKVSGVLLYKDGGSGTTTLGTHLRVYFTCNGGTNWTEVLAADMTVVSPFFSGTTKMVKLAEKTCTSGSDVRYKVEWASQSTGVIETQLHGIGLNY